MTDKGKIKVVGIALGIAFFVCLGLMFSIGANTTSQLDLTTGTVPDVSGRSGAPAGKGFRRGGRACEAGGGQRVFREKVVKYQVARIRRCPSAMIFSASFSGSSCLPLASSPGEPPKEYKVPQRGMGSGMILDRQGHIFTNYHVVEDVDEIKVQLPDKRWLKRRLWDSLSPNQM